MWYLYLLLFLYLLTPGLKWVLSRIPKQAVYIVLAVLLVEGSIRPFPLGISLPLFFLGTLLSAAVLAWVLRKIPLLKKYVL